MSHAVRPRIPLLTPALSSPTGRRGRTGGAHFVPPPPFGGRGTGGGGNSWGRSEPVSSKRVPGTATTASFRIATGTLALAALGASIAAEASSVAPRDRLLGAVARHAALPAALGAEIERRCPADGTRCAAQLIADSLPAARLVPVNHPDTDTIRRAHTVPSVSAVEQRSDGALALVLDRFGRTADREIADAVAAHALAAPAWLVLDLRANAGGDFDRMRRVASLFTGPMEGAIRLLGREGASDVALPAPLRAIGEFEIDVLIGPGTASSAEVLAALLRRYAGARLIGKPTLGKDWLTRLVPVDHDWRLAIPAERIEVPGETLAQGLVPDIEAAPIVEP